MPSTGRSGNLTQPSRYSKMIRVYENQHLNHQANAILTQLLGFTIIIKFYCRVNSLLYDFKDIPCDVKAKLLDSYCLDVYGSLL